MNLPDDIISSPRLAVITGAAGGLGAALATHLDTLGWATIRIDLRQPELAVTTPFTQPTVYLTCDVRDEVALYELGSLVTRAREAFLVVSAAGVISVGLAETLELSEWERVIGVNLTGAFITLRSFIAAAAAADNGRLIAISSDAGKTGEGWLSHYSAAKFGVIGFVQSLALELIARGVTVNAICPSIVETPMMGQLAEQMAGATGEGDAASWRAKFVAEIPAGRPCLPDDVAAAVSFLAGRDAGFITGQALNVAGGHEVH